MNYQSFFILCACIIFIISCPQEDSDVSMKNVEDSSEEEASQQEQSSIKEQRQSQIASNSNIAASFRTDFPPSNPRVSEINSYEIVHHIPPYNPIAIQEEFSPYLRDNSKEAKTVDCTQNQQTEICTNIHISQEQPEINCDDIEVNSINSNSPVVGDLGDNLDKSFEKFLKQYGKQQLVENCEYNSTAINSYLMGLGRTEEKGSDSELQFQQCQSINKKTEKKEENEKIMLEKKRSRLIEKEDNNISEEEERRKMQKKK